MLTFFKTRLICTAALILFVSSCSTTENIPKYNRTDWAGWKTKNCINTRHQLLKTKSITSPKINVKGCTVVDGLWLDFYTGESITAADKPEIDHIIPLKHAHTLGAYRWSRARRNAFYNDPENLVITSRSMNREKQDKSFVDWSPLNRDLSCKYAHRWILVKLKYNLDFKKEECFNFKSLENKRSCPIPLPKVRFCRNVLILNSAKSHQ